MRSTINNKHLLVQSLLASTLFMVPAMGQADVLNSVQTGPYTSLANGNVTITQTGRIASGAGDVPYTFNTNDAALTLYQGNKYYDSGTIIPTNKTAVNIFPNAQNALITVNPVSSIYGSSKLSLANVINVFGDNAQLNNAGVLYLNGARGVIRVFSPSEGFTVLNDVTGAIVSNRLGTKATILTDSGTSDFALNNLGVIRTVTNPAANSKIPAIEVNGHFDSIENSGFILQNGHNATGNAPAIYIKSASGSGNITNTGTGIISVSADDANTLAVAIDGVIDNFTNNGIIQDLSTKSSTFGIAVGFDTNANVTTFKNTGLIYNTNPTSNTPSGTIVSFSTQPLKNPLINTGNIVNSAVGKVAIDFEAVEFGSIDNSGNIVGNVLLAQTGVTNDDGDRLPVLSMSDGTITGRVIGNADAQNNIIQIEGGTLVSVEHPTPYNRQGSFVYNLPGGEISDYLKTAPAGGTFEIPSSVVLLHGVNAGRVIASGTFDFFGLSDGSFTSLELGPTLGPSVFSVLFVESQVSSDASIDTRAVNIGVGITFDTLSGIELHDASGTVFTQNQLIKTTSWVTDTSSSVVQNAMTYFSEPSLAGMFDFVNSGTHIIPTKNAVLLLTNSSEAQFINLGTLLLGSEGVFRIIGNVDGSTEGGTLFGAAPSNGLISSINVNIFGPPCGDPYYGKMIVDSFTTSTNPNSSVQAVVLKDATFIQPTFKGYMREGAELDIIRVNTGGFANPLSPLTITNDAALVQPASALVSFTQDTFVLPIEGSQFGVNQYTSVVQLTSHRKSFLSMSNSKVTPGIAQVLDGFADSGCITNPTMYALISDFDQIPTRTGVEDAMESLIPGFNYGLIAGSLVGMKSVFEAVDDRIEHPHQGRSFGDTTIDAGVWMRAIGAYLDQGARDGVSGYLAKGTGFAIGADWDPYDSALVGIAVSYTKVNVDDKAFAPKDDDIKSLQGTLYGAYDFDCGIYLDAMLAYARNDYKTNRVIHVNQLLTAARGSFDGSQWGAQGDLGVVIPNTGALFVSPFVRLRYFDVHFDAYNESGSDLALNVSSQKAREFLGGIGLRLGTEYQQCNVTWLPEVMAVVGHDFHIDGEQTLAGFTTIASPAFQTNGIIPGKTVLDTGIALNGICGASVITAKYNLELRESFVGNSAYLQYYFNWG